MKVGFKKFFMSVPLVQNDLLGVFLHCLAQLVDLLVM